MNSPNLIDLLSCRLACELINNPNYLYAEFNGEVDKENKKLIKLI